MSNYKLIRKSINQLQQLEDEVNRLLSLGWTVVGEVKQAECDKTTIFIQQLEYDKNRVYKEIIQETIQENEYIPYILF